MKLLTGMQREKGAICKIINRKGNILECVYPPDSYIFHYKKKLFEMYFTEIQGLN